MLPVLDTKFSRWKAWAKAGKAGQYVTAPLIFEHFGEYDHGLAQNSFLRKTYKLKE